MKAKDLVPIAKQSFQEWMEDRAPNEAAALAYYTLLSVPAMLLLIQWLLGRVVSDQVQEQVVDFVQRSVRGGGGEAIKVMIENADSPGSGGAIATIVSLATLAVSATGVVTHLEQSLNRMWEIAEEDVGIRGKIRERLSSLLAVLVLGAFLVVTVTLSTAVSGFAETLMGDLPFGEWSVQLVNIALSLLLLTLLLGATLKIIPDAVVAWSDVWLGATVTAVLFIIGQYALSLYLGKSAPGSAYGPAGSVIAFVVWIYYSALILFLGAEFTQVYANRFGSHIQPDDAAITLEEKVHREQSHPAREPEADVDHAANSTVRRREGEQLYANDGRWQDTTSELYDADAAQNAEGETGGEASRLKYYALGLLAVALAVARWLRGSREAL